MNPATKATKSNDEELSYVYTEKYLEALKAFEANDMEKIKIIVVEWMKAFNKARKELIQNPELSAHLTPLQKSTPLHLAVQCASFEVVTYLLNLKSPKIPINVKDGHGMTELHYAIKASRADVVKALLDAGADENIEDANNNDGLMLAVNQDIEQLIHDHRDQEVGELTAKLFSMAIQNDVQGLKTLMNDETLQPKINLMARDTLDGKTILHIAAQKNNIDLAIWAIQHGVDLFATDYDDKMAYSYIKDDRMQEVFDQAPLANNFGIISENAPRYSGMLEKWTNYAGGWKSRWFDLESGVLSYYKAKEDAGNSCRGALNLKVARIVFSHKDKRQFEVHGKGSVKFQLRAKTLSEAKKWVHLLNLSKQWAIDRTETTEIPPEGNGAILFPETQNGNISTADQNIYSSNDVNSNYGRFGSLPEKSSRFSASINNEARSERGGGITSRLSTSLGVPKLRQGNASVMSGLNADRTKSLTGRSHENTPRKPSIKAGLNSTQNDVESKSQISKYSDSESIENSKKLMEDFLSMVDHIESQIRGISVTLRELKLMPEQQINKKVVSEFLASIEERVESIEIKLPDLRYTYSTNNTFWKQKLGDELKRIDTLADTLQSAVMDTQRAGERMISRGSRQSFNSSSSKYETAKQSQIIQDYDSDEDDEQFADALDTLDENLEPQWLKTTSTKVEEIAQTEQDEEEAKLEAAVNKYNLEGYDPSGKIRTSLPEDDKVKPSISLWGIIKSAIGKDLSKISMPVYFNEPTSFLQRFSEDLEYSDLLDIAAHLPKSADRTMLVASYAMSNYSSTFGRIAKPFNPLLGETYEYVRPDKRFRAFSEQVVHHPPISALWVQAHNYDFHADTVIKSKFTGKSMDITPDCVCHVYLKVPLEFLDKGSDAALGPRIKQPEIFEEKGYFVEHYSWRKLSTSVNGIITGSFWIEHYGDLNVQNHSTGDETVLTFKRSGWLGDNKFRVTGHSQNRVGEITHLISGKWISRIVAKPVSFKKETFEYNENSNENIDDSLMNQYSTFTNLSDKNENGEANGTGDKSATDSNSSSGTLNLELPKGPFILWQRNPLPSKPMKYNLTEFATSLNEINDDLRKYIAPSDSRLRPDQRAMEVDEFSLADSEKTRLEEKQRAVRKKMESGVIPKWSPRWERVAKEIDSGKTNATWKDVPDIF
ncbi:hypothetical protein BB559_001154 [Furculomyces boomerangus]|uniref:PH domain-containing protein n=1 Tax=Furculomyces boomerangus TaxID=61424 RepID=A0A2T9Z2V8_9FUNG|nr:hypothetical protein BB559_001154 [Furculomyces boomerangus]